MPQSQSWLSLQYERPQADPEPVLKRKQPFDDYCYRPSQGIEKPSLTAKNGIEKSLYQTTYHPQHDTFYQSPKRAKAESMFGYGNSYSQWLYELPSNLEKASGYAKPIDNVFTNLSIITMHQVLMRKLLKRKQTAEDQI